MSKKNTYTKSLLKGGNLLLSNSSAIFNSRIVLYFIFVLSIANLFYLATSLNYMFVSIFILVGFITSFFSKNMVVILCIALTVTNVLQYGNKAAMEGFDEKDTPTDDEDEIVSPKSEESADIAATKDKKSQQNLDGLKDSYKELLSLQGQIQDGMDNINGPLTKAEDIVKKMALDMGVPI